VINPHNELPTMLHAVAFTKIQPVFPDRKKPGFQILQP
jgi:hypothetical protein